MISHMILQHGCICQHYSTFLTFNHWILLFMNLSMVWQTTRCSKCSSTGFTFKIPFTSVYSNMTEHVGFGSKHFVTIWTWNINLLLELQPNLNKRLSHMELSEHRESDDAWAYQFSDKRPCHRDHNSRSVHPAINNFQLMALFSNDNQSGNYGMNFQMSKIFCSILEFIGAVRTLMFSGII